MLNIFSLLFSSVYLKVLLTWLSWTIDSFLILSLQHIFSFFLHSFLPPSLLLSLPPMFPPSIPSFLLLFDMGGAFWFTSGYSGWAICWGIPSVGILRFFFLGWSDSPQKFFCFFFTEFWLQNLGSWVCGWHRGAGKFPFQCVYSD